MSVDVFTGGALRAALLLLLALASMRLLRGAPASLRRLVLSLVLAGALVLPAVSALAPSLRVAAPAPIAAIGRAPSVEPIVEAGAAPEVKAAAPRAMTATSRVDAGAIAIAVWALGALAVLLRLGVGLARSRVVVRRSRPAPRWDAAAARAREATGIQIEVRVTDELDTPAVTGVIAPVVLVPRDAEAWSEERRDLVLAHELAHVRERDCLAQIVAALACAAHWFDPLAWIAARRLRLERELAADDAVLAGGARATRYAEELVAIAGGAIGAHAGTLAMAERSALGARIASIVAAGRSRSAISPARRGLLFAGMAAVLMVVACATPEPPPPSAAPPASGAAATIDARIQRIADEEIDRTMSEWQAAAGVIVVLDPASGEILASAGRAGGARADVAAGKAYVTGSTLKGIVLAAALAEGVITPADRFDCENGKRDYGGRVLRDAGSNGVLTVPEMLAVSTNVGFSKVFDRLGGARLEQWIERFHFGAAPPVAGAVSGDRPGRPADGSFEGAVLASGEAMKASPLQMAAAYATFANDGVYVSPTMVKRASAPREQLLRPEVSRAVVSMLDGVVNGERGTGGLARVNGARVAGKTGTASWDLPGGGEGIYASFVGLVPMEKPRFVILVGVEQPRGGESGGKVAAPVFARVAARALGG